MNKIVNFEGVKATVQKSRVKFLTAAFIAVASITFAGCNQTNTPATGGGAAIIDPNETAATVNGKAIKLEEVERGVKQQAQGQEDKLSPLELASARLQVLEGLIQNEVLYQKAEKESAVPTEEQVTAEVNKRKTESKVSAEKFDEQMKQAGMTEASFRDTIKKGLAVQNLIDKITGKIEPPKDSEIEAFYNGNKEAFVNKRGVKLAAIVIDPTDNGEGDTTKNQQDAVIKANEVIKQLQQPGADFAAVAREKSEDQSKLQGGDLGYITEDDLRESFPPQVAATLMDPKFQVGQSTGAQVRGKYYILKLQQRNDKDENLTLESPGVREKVIEQLVGSRKQLLSQSYAAIAMNEAKIENYLAQKVVNNPNELSGARPAGSANANANSAANANTNTNNADAPVSPTPGGVKPAPSAATGKANANK